MLTSPSRKDLPSIGTMLDDAKVRERFRLFPRKMLAAAMRRVVAQWRQFLSRGEKPPAGLSKKAFLDQVERALWSLNRPGLRPVINATGVVLNTNLGRSPLPQGAIRALGNAGCGYCNLETDLKTGSRGHRAGHAEDLLTRLTGSPAAMVVNNNAAAVLLILNTFAKGKEVIVSRGELIEIGGSFRLPDVMVSSEAQLVEVGTTNRTYLEDYRRAISPRTALLFRSHTSNYLVVGFAHRPTLAELVRLGRRRHLLTVEDLGSGLLARKGVPELSGEPTVAEALKSGVDLVCFSGDKLLGGPQCGLILGRQRLITQLRKNPLARAVRVGKLTLVALEAVLRVYLYDDDPAGNLPHLRAIKLTPQTLRRRGGNLLKSMKDRSADVLQAELVDGYSTVGGGSYPNAQLATCLIALRAKGVSAKRLARLLRTGDPPVMSRVAEGRLLLDLRTVPTAQLKDLSRALNGLCEHLRSHRKE